MAYLYLLLGLAILVAGAELLVRGAVAFAELAKISSLVIGLTVVAFGTSAPELAVSSVSSLKGDSAIALGNVVGSNVFNVLLILGLSAIIVPLSVASQLVRLDVPIMITSSVAVWLAAYDGTIERWESVCMLVAFLIYTSWLIRAGRKESRASAPDVDPPPRTTLQKIVSNIGLVAFGLALLVWGAQMLVDSATTIARTFGVSDLVIGLTIVAAGTSLPELATSLVAAIKGQRDIAVGNVVGSNVFNLLMVLATASVLSNSGLPVSSDVLWFDLAVMVWVAVLCWPIFLSHGTVTRAEGAVMLVLYLVYTVLLVADSMEMDWTPLIKTTLVFGAFPSVCLAASYFVLRSYRLNHHSGSARSDQ